MKLAFQKKRKYTGKFGTASAPLLFTSHSYVQNITMFSNYEENTRDNPMFGTISLTQVLCLQKDNPVFENF